MMRKTLLLTLLLAAAMTAGAQSISRSYKEASMADVLIDLDRASAAYRISFIYNELEDYTVSVSFRNKTVPEAVREVVGFYPMNIAIGDSLITVECIDKSRRKLMGRITDEEGKPVAFANIRLLNPADSTLITGGVSNENGDFVIPCAADSVLAKFTSVGFETAWLATTPRNIGSLTMRARSYTINGAVVKGSAPKYKITPGGVSVNVENSLLALAGTATDVLAQLPRVSVDAKGGVSVFAKGTPEIYINGRIVRDAEDLKRLKSSDIRNVDVLTSPGAKYNAEAQSVIVIHTKPQKGDGFSARAEASAEYNLYWAGNGQIDTRYRKDGLEFFNTAQWRRLVDFEGNTVSYRINSGGYDTRILHPMDFLYTAQIFSDRAGFNLDVNSDNSLGAYYQISKAFDTDGHCVGGDGRHTLTVLRGDTLAGKIVEEDWMQQPEGPSHEVSAYYSGKAGKMSIDVNASYVWKKDRRDDYMTERSAVFASRDTRTNTMRHNNLTAGKVVLGYPLWKGTVSAGAEATHTSTHNVYSTSDELIPDSKTDIKEDNLATFAEYELPIGNWSFDAGLRYEHVSTDYRSQGRKEREPSRTYGELFPNASAAWRKGDWDVSLAYTRKTSRPPYYMMRDFVQYNGQFLYDAGNPYLRPAMLDNAEFNAVWKWITLCAGYTYVAKPMEKMMSLYQGREIIYAHSENLNRYQVAYASLELSPKIGFWQPDFELYFTKPFFNAAKVGITKNMQEPYVGIGANNRFVVAKHNFFTLRLAYSTAKSARTAKIAPVYFVNAGYTCTFFHDALQLNVNANDLFKTNKERWTSYGAGLSLKKDCYYRTRSLRLTLTYNFNTGKNHYKGTGAGNAEKSRL